MAGGALDFLINIKQQLTGGNVAGQLSALEEKIKGETKALQNLEAMMKRMQSANSVDVEQYRHVQSRIDAKKTSLASLSEQLNRQTIAQDKAGAGVENFGEKLQALKAGPIGAVIAALILVGTLIVVTGFKLAQFALTAADTHRSFMLVLEGATGSAEGAKAAASEISKLSSKLPLTSARLEEMARKLAVAKLSGAQFSETLETLGTVASVAGDQAVGKLEELVNKSKALGQFKLEGESLAGTGLEVAEVYEALAKRLGKSTDQIAGLVKAGKVSVDDGLAALNATVKKRFGDVAARQALAFPIQIAKLHENLEKLFKDVGIENFLKGLHGVTSLLDENSASGQALRLMVTTVFTALFDGAAKAFPYIKAFFQGMIIAALLVYITVMRVARAIQSAFGGESKSSIDWIKVAMYAGIVAMLAMVTIAVVLAAAFAIVAFSILLALSPLLILIAIFVLLAAGAAYVGGVILDSFSAAMAFLSSLDFAEIGINLIEGLANGISSGATMVYDAIASLAKGAMSKLTGLLGIHSPSVVFKGYGLHTAAGFAQGVDAGADDAQASVQAMVSKPEAGGAARSGRAGGVRLEKLADVIEIHGRDAEDIFAQLEERVMAMLERADLSGPEPEGAT